MSVFFALEDTNFFNTSFCCHKQDPEGFVASENRFLISGSIRLHWGWWAPYLLVHTQWWTSGIEWQRKMRDAVTLYHKLSLSGWCRRVYCKLRKFLAIWIGGGPSVLDGQGMAVLWVLCFWWLSSHSLLCCSLLSNSCLYKAAVTGAVCFLRWKPCQNFHCWGKAQRNQKEPKRTGENRKGCDGVVQKHALQTF